jgi:hypothetical protein
MLAFHGAYGRHDHCAHVRRAELQSRGERNRGSLAAWPERASTVAAARAAAMTAMMRRGLVSRTRTGEVHRLSLPR